jgi:hypothetical protein
MEFNKRLTNCRRLSEMAFGRLKGRWSVCTRNKSYYDPQLCKSIVEACCGLHNFLECRGRPMPDGFVENGNIEIELPPVGAAVQQQAGITKRDLLKRWIMEN